MNSPTTHIGWMTLPGGSEEKIYNFVKYQVSKKKLQVSKKFFFFSSLQTKEGKSQTYLKKGQQHLMK